MVGFVLLHLDRPPSWPRRDVSQGETSCTCFGESAARQSSCISSSAWNLTFKVGALVLRRTLEAICAQYWQYKTS